MSISRTALLLAMVAGLAGCGGLPPMPIRRHLHGALLIDPRSMRPWARFTIAYSGWVAILIFAARRFSRFLHVAFLICDRFQTVGFGMCISFKGEKNMNTSMSMHQRAWLVAGLFFVVGVPAMAGDDRDNDANEAQVRRGYQIVPPGVKLNLMGKNRTLVGLGSYIVNTSGCIDCHSHPTYAPGGDPFLGQPEVVNANDYLSGGRQFGPITSANITPDFAGRPAGLTRAEFITMMRTGHNPKDPPGQIVQVMPWPVFGKKTTEDLHAIYEYLRAIPSLPDNTHPGP